MNGVVGAALQAVQQVGSGDVKEYGTCDPKAGLERVSYVAPPRVFVMRTCKTTEAQRPQRKPWEMVERLRVFLRGYLTLFSSMPPVKKKSRGGTAVATRGGRDRARTYDLTDVNRAL